MAKLMALIAIVFSSSTVLAMDFSWPDFSMQTRYEMDYIAANSDVKAYVQALGANRFRVTRGKPAPRVYAVKTSNGCTFDVEVVYQDWPGIDGLIVDSAVCR